MDKIEKKTAFIDDRKHLHRICGKASLFLLLALFCVGSLSGCKKKTEEQTEGKEKSTEKVEEGELKSDSIVITVGRETVTYAQMLVYAYILQEMYNPAFGEELWQYELDSESTMEDYAREELVSMVTQIKVIGLQAEKQDVMLDNDEKTEMAGKAQEFYDGISKKKREKYQLSLEMVEKTFQENALATKMFYLATQEIETDIPDEEARQAHIQYLRLDIGKTQRGDVQVEMSEKTKNATRGRMKRLREEAKEVDSFFSFASENSDSDEVEVSLGYDSDGYDKAFLDAAMSMKDETLSQVIEGEDALYLIYCVDSFDEDATLARKEAIIQEQENELFKSKYASWLSNYEVSVSNAFWEQIHI